MPLIVVIAVTVVSSGNGWYGTGSIAIDIIKLYQIAYHQNKNDSESLYAGRDFEPYSRELVLLGQGDARAPEQVARDGTIERRTPSKRNKTEEVLNLHKAFAHNAVQTKYKEISNNLETVIPPKSPPGTVFPPLSNSNSLSPPNHLYPLTTDPTSPGPYKTKPPPAIQRPTPKVSTPTPPGNSKPPPTRHSKPTSTRQGISKPTSPPRHSKQPPPGIASKPTLHLPTRHSKPTSTRLASQAKPPHRHREQPNLHQAYTKRTYTPSNTKTLYQIFINQSITPFSRHEDLISSKHLHHHQKLQPDLHHTEISSARHTGPTSHTSVPSPPDTPPLDHTASLRKTKPPTIVSRHTAPNQNPPQDTPPRPPPDTPPRHTRPRHTARPPPDRPSPTSAETTRPDLRQTHRPDLHQISTAPTFHQTHRPDLPHSHTARPPRSSRPDLRRHTRSRDHTATRTAPTSDHPPDTHAPTSRPDTPPDLHQTLPDHLTTRHTAPHRQTPPDTPPRPPPDTPPRPPPDTPPRPPPDTTHRTQTHAPTSRQTHRPDLQTHRPDLHPPRPPPDTPPDLRRHTAPTSTRHTAPTSARPHRIRPPAKTQRVHLPAESWTRQRRCVMVSAAPACSFGHLSYLVSLCPTLLPASQ
nr:proteoglycan 4-like [Penaeus vannamei]